MSRRWFLLALMALLLSSAPALAAGSTVVTETTTGALRIISVAWTSDASGNVSGHAISIGAGRVVHVIAIPGTGGTTPTDLYDVSLVDHYGIDVLGGEGANQPQTIGSRAQAPDVLLLPGETIDPVIANAGNAKTGTLIIVVGP